MKRFQKLQSAVTVKKNKRLLPANYAQIIPFYFCVRPCFEGIWGYKDELYVHTFFLELTPKNVPGNKHERNNVIAIFHAEKIGLFFQTPAAIIAFTKKLMAQDILEKVLDYYSEHNEFIELTAKDLGVTAKESYS